MRDVPRVASVWRSDSGWCLLAPLTARVGVGLPVQRLKSRAQFQAAMAGGTVVRTPHFALHRCALSAGAVDAAESLRLPASALFSVRDVWLGAMVPKRWARKAVTRNTIKRQIYSVSQELAAALPMAAHVVRLRATFDKTLFISAQSEQLKVAVRAELRQLFGGVATP